MSRHEYEIVRIHCVHTLPRDEAAEVVVDFGARGRSSAVQIKPGKTIDVDTLREMAATLPWLAGLLLTEAFAVDDSAGFTVYERASTEAEALAAAEAQDDDDDAPDFVGPEGDAVGAVDVAAMARPAPGEVADHTVVLERGGAHYEVTVRVRDAAPPDRAGHGGDNGVAQA